jgi:hypothetical protein
VRRRPRIAIAGALAQKPRVAGHTWVFLQYLLGLRRLGFDVLLIDRLEPGMAVDAAGEPCPPEQSENLRYLLQVALEFDLVQSFVVLCDGGTRTIGWPRARVIEWLRDSVCLLNIMGYLDDEDLLGQAAKRVFLDIDPGIGQMWRELGLADVFAGHDAYVTIGGNIGRPDCGIPTCGLPWIASRQPVVLDQWPVTPGPADGPFTSIATWRGTYAPIEYRGRTYGQRVHEFRRFAAVPRHTGRPFRLALDIDPREQGDLALLKGNDWSLVSPRRVAATPSSYRAFIQESKAEFMVAKTIVVDTRSGWFSDRSICYLASGRPVLVQDTGLDGLYPVGQGLVTYRTEEEAIAGVDEIWTDFPRHARAAREIACEYFDATKVLGRLLERIDVA